MIKLKLNLNILDMYFKYNQIIRTIYINTKIQAKIKYTFLTKNYWVSR